MVAPLISNGEWSAGVNVCAWAPSLLVVFITAEMDFHNILYQRHVALPIENVAMTKYCMFLRYQIYILTSCEFVDDLQMGISIYFGNHGCACRFPYFFGRRP